MKSANNSAKSCGRPLAVEAAPEVPVDLAVVRALDAVGDVGAADPAVALLPE